ncbi:hypothetical protein WR25_02339 [Diploscapter pachys]|uniref:Uncharacterized protein n=1 Tax=Diploscapter pachys TaxID=2018661 RepID=A0A2A2K143_9BILA|nr:hypothetical protein WR25_02339 [Diploscapter pachys]
MFHLLICCFGGQPFVDFDKRGDSLNSKYRSLQPIDPTDWTAEETPLDLVNLTLISPEKLVLPSIDHSLCSLFNLTFTTVTEEAIFEHYKARIECRCLVGHDCSPACDCLPSATSAISTIGPVLPSPEALYSFSGKSAVTITPPPPMLFIAAAVLLALFVLIFVMTKGCFCDCFGPFKWPGREDSYDKPMDPEDVRKCLERVRASERQQEASGSGAPLVSSLSHNCPMAYPSAPPQIEHRSHSPPPPYSEVMEERNQTVMGRQITQI